MNHCGPSHPTLTAARRSVVTGRGCQTNPSPRTRSLRSDIDLLVVPTEKTHIQARNVREHAAAVCPALDVFVVEGGKAVSAVNDSFVGADSLVALVELLEAVLIWNEGGVVPDADVEWQVRLHDSVTFVEPVS